MTFTEAAVEALRRAKRPLHYKEITTWAIEHKLLDHIGKSPEVTMGSRLAALFKKGNTTNPLVRVRPGVFALHEWEQSGELEHMFQPPADEPQEPEDAPVASAQPSALEKSEASAPPAEVPLPAPPEAKVSTPIAPTALDPKPHAPPLDTSHQHTTALERESSFDDEGAEGDPMDFDDESAVQDTELDRDSLRRRRRRRRRPQSTDLGLAEESPAPAVRPSQPAHDPPAPKPHPVVVDVIPVDKQLGPHEDLAGRELADAVAIALGASDRSAGSVSLRQLAELLQRKARPGTDLPQLQSQISSSVRADNLRRADLGIRPRFRLAAGRVGLTDWLLSDELLRAEQAAVAAVERYRDVSRRSLLKKLQELPSHSFIELVLLLLERTGFRSIRGVRRPGVSSHEVHFAAVHDTSVSEIATAIVIRRDGREVGRERVAELRGSLHHYGPAAVGWIMTVGNVLSGAREEAALATSAPIVLFDGNAIARGCERSNVAVVRSTLPITIPDTDLFESLKAL